MGDAVGERDSLEVGGTVLQGDFLSYPFARHIILEGKHVVTDDFATLPDGDFGGEILGVQKALAIGRITYTVVAVP